MQLNHVGNATSKTIEKCSICREALTEQIASINGCAHRFHKDCISSWAEIANTCPLCVVRFNFIIQGRRKYKVKDKKQRNADADNEEDMVNYEEIACSICHSADYSFVALLCDGCNGCYHTHCIGLSEVPEGDWYCETCKHLEHRASDADILNHGFRQRLNGTNNVRRQRRTQRRQRNNNEYDLNDTQLFSQNERNPEWLQADDEEWRPSKSENESDSDEEFGYENNKNMKKNRKRKWNEIESDEDNDDMIILSNNHNHKKRRKIDKKWKCEQCTFENKNESEYCSMCETKKKKINKKWSSENRYKKKSRTKANIKDNERRQCSVNSIVGDDILNFFDMDSDENEDNDLLMNINRNKNINKIRETVEKNDENVQSDIEFKPKPKGKYRERYKKRYLKKPSLT